MSSNDSVSRRDQILQSLAHMLESNPGQTITTAKLAKEVGVSEAACTVTSQVKPKCLKG